MLGGEIQLESKVNEGSSFFVYLPTQVQAGSSVQSRPQADTKPESKDTEKKAEDTKQQAELPPFIEDDRNNTLNEQTVLIIHPSKPQAEKFFQQAKAKNFQAIVARDIQEGITLAEKFQPKAIMLAFDYANIKNPHYQQLKKHPLIGKLPVHLITPIDQNGKEENIELKTLETIEFADALKLLDSDIQSPLKRILLIEDDDVTRTIIADLLSVLDIEIAQARSAGEAFEMLNKRDFDCIILDLGLPDYSGNELLEKLKKNNISIPKVIIYTGKEMSESEIKSLNYYTDTIILKGIKSDERLMDEVTLFLHQVSKSIPDAKPQTSHIADNDILFKGKKILVVDDDIRNVFSLAQMLEERDIEVVEAENGQVAIDILNKEKDIDLVLMDIMMPVMDGYEAMGIIRKTPEIKDIPIICLTAKAMKEDHENALKNGANDYLSKPLNEEKLFSMLKIWLYKK